MKFKILILFVCFSAISTICNAQEGMTEHGARILVIGSLIIIATILNYLLLLIRFGNAYISIISTIIIIVLIYFATISFKEWDFDGRLIAFSFLITNIISLVISLKRLRKKLKSK